MYNSTNVPGSKCSRERIGQGPMETFAPGSELALGVKRMWFRQTIRKRSGTVYSGTECICINQRCADTSFSFPNLIRICYKLSIAAQPIENGIRILSVSIYNFICY